MTEKELFALISASKHAEQLIEFNCTIEMGKNFKLGSNTLSKWKCRLLKIKLTENPDNQDDQTDLSKIESIIKKLASHKDVRTGLQELRMICNGTIIDQLN